MYGILLPLHSLLRWIILILLLAAIIKSFSGWFGKRQYAKSDDKISLFLMISAHTQLLVGFVLYFVSPFVSFSNMSETMQNPEMRFFTVEHVFMMLIAIALITIGRISAKKATEDVKKFRRGAIYFTLALLIIFMAIPWPFSAVARPWF